MAELHSITEVAAAFGLSVPALRYYEECGLVTPTTRRGRVRYYDREALERLALVQLWHVDGMIPISGTTAVLASEQADERQALLLAQREEMLARARRLQHAAAVLTHMLNCGRDRPLDCPTTSAHIRARVDAALSGEDLVDGFLPPQPDPGREALTVRATA
ncbi:MerR family transcriptional regulator [Kitasatospora sp. SUK 42]|uniref:MerR family transcriptional regulator n=1 Tax=Kitasatospora sp. SUK 42 TaxID=1588882 RepID=UPI001C31BD52|nr:MerR family transcriptional regulator [Kitasatospora sp. SUK 42]MBV2155604.1 MerR family transcriptional regulator [Kitasatospora sp. SUK 42]